MHCAFLFDVNERAGNEVRSYAKRTNNEKENACGERVFIKVGTYVYQDCLTSRISDEVLFLGTKRSEEGMRREM